jgi:hypothetical protein
MPSVYIAMTKAQQIPMVGFYGKRQEPDFDYLYYSTITAGEKVTTISPASPALEG